MADEEPDDKEQDKESGRTWAGIRHVAYNIGVGALKGAVIGGIGLAAATLPFAAVPTLYSAVFGGTAGANFIATMFATGAIGGGLTGGLLGLSSGVSGAADAIADEEEGVRITEARKRAQEMQLAMYERQKEDMRQGGMPIRVPQGLPSRMDRDREYQV